MASETMAWIAVDGTSTSLSDPFAVKETQGRAGIFLARPRFIEETVPLQPGSRLRSVTHDCREVDVPVVIRGTSAGDLRSRIRALMLSLDPTRGDGKLRITDTTGQQRELVCRYAGGLEGDEGTQNAWTTWLRAAITFRAVDPFWYAVSPVVSSYAITAAPATFFPFFPLRLAGATVFADTNVVNGGDTEAWPVWTITGPGITIILRNLTTVEVLEVDATLAAGEGLVIDTRPAHKTLTKNDGSSLFSSLAWGSALWSLIRGTNAVRLEMGSATSDSLITLSYYPRYLGA